MFTAVCSIQSLDLIIAESATDETRNTAAPLAECYYHFHVLICYSANPHTHLKGFIRPTNVPTVTVHCPLIKSAAHDTQDGATCPLQSKRALHTNEEQSTQREDYRVAPPLMKPET